MKNLTKKDFKFSTFGLIDMRGCKARAEMDKAERKMKDGSKDAFAIPVVIHATITNSWGSYDGIGQEFELDIKKVDVKLPVKELRK